MRREIDIVRERLKRGSTGLEVDGGGLLARDMQGNEGVKRQ